MEVVSTLCNIGSFLYTITSNRPQTPYNWDIPSKLKFISNIKPNQKLNVKDMMLQPDTMATSFSRTFVSYDTRYNTIRFLEQTIEDAFAMIRDETIVPVVKTNLLNDLILAKRGLENMKKTYESDVLIGCKLDTLCEKIIVFKMEYDANTSSQHNQSKKEWKK